MEEAVKEKGSGQEWEEEDLFPLPPNCSVAFLGMGKEKKEAEKVAKAFSCRAFCIEEGEGEGSEVSFLPGGGQILSLKAPKEAPLSHLLSPLLPEEASLVVFRPGKVEIKSGLYDMSSCFITDVGSREVVKNFSLLKAAGKKAIDLSWVRSEEWRERIRASLLSRNPAFFEVETGSLDALSLLLAGWAKEEFYLPTKFKQASSYSSSVESVTFGAPGWQVCIRQAEDKGAFEIREGANSFFAPKTLHGVGELLVRQMELLPPDPLYFRCLEFEAQGAKDVG